MHNIWVGGPSSFECGSSRPWIKSAWVNSAQLYRSGPIMPTINFHEGCNFEVCFIYKKKCSTKVGGINVWLNLYCWSVNLVSLNGSDFITGSEITIREKDKKYIFCVAYFYFFLNKREIISGAFHHGFTNM